MSETQENSIYTDVLEDFSPESVSHFRPGSRESITCFVQSVVFRTLDPIESRLCHSESEKRRVPSTNPAP